MKIKESPGRIVFKIINTCLMILLAVMCIVPLWHVLMSSISDPTLLIRNYGLVLWPLYDEAHAVTLKGYQLVFKNDSLIRAYANTIFYCGVGTAFRLLMSCMTAYCMSRKGTMFMGYVVMLMLFTMFFGGGMIPTYLVNKKLGLVNTRAALIIPGSIAFYNCVILRTNFTSIPISLEESAQLDGAGHMKIMFSIVLPLSKAAIAVIGLFIFVGEWNQYLQAVIYLMNRKLYPLQVILREILIENDTSEVDLSGEGYADLDAYKELVQYTTIIVATAPILCVYPFIQKYFVKGVMIGSVKG